MKGLPAASAIPLPVIRPTSTPPIRSGPRRGGDAVEFARADVRALQRAADQRVDDFDVGARRDFGDDAAIGGMRGDLADQLVGENFAGPVRPQPDDGGGGLVASGLDSQNAHCEVCRSLPAPRVGRAAESVSIRLARRATEPKVFSPVPGTGVPVCDGSA